MNSQRQHMLLLFLILMCFQPTSAIDAYDLVADIPNCYLIAPSTSQIYIINIGPQVLAASFVLDWKNDASSLKLILRSPDGYIIGEGNAAIPGLVQTKGGSSESYSIPRPKTGKWTAEVVSGDLLKATEDYCLAAHLEQAPPRRDARFNGLFKDFQPKKKMTFAPEGGIALSAGIDVLKAGNYSIYGSIQDLKVGKEIPIYGQSYLRLGAQDLVINIDNISSSGPFLVKKLYLYDESNELMDVLSNYTTKEYAELNDRNPSGQLTGYLSDHGSDFNGDGLYDYLTIDIGVRIREPDYYSLMGSLYDSLGRKIAWSVVSANLSAGDHIMHLDFDGKLIHSQELSGQYYVKYLRLFTGDADKNTTMENARIDDYIAKYYNYTQFADGVGL
jgi:hypothetical protein